jgi:hypothetical protein
MPIFADSFYRKKAIHMLRKLILPLLILFVNLSSYSQTFTVEDDTAANCQAASVDVLASGFPNDVAAITLYIDYDSTVVSYSSFTSGTIGPLVNAIPGRVGISWFNFTSGQPIDGIMFTLHFDYSSGSAVFDLDENSTDVTDINLNPITANHINGSINPLPADTIYVDASVGSSGDGQGWATALKTIGEAANLPLNAGDKILVKPGTYAESVNIKSNGTEIIPATTGVTLSDTNKIQFPAGTDLSCVDPINQPGEFYAYVFRSLKSNNGYYQIISVNDTMDYVTVSDAGFFPETGSPGDSSLVMAALGRPVTYMKDPAANEFQRVVIDISTVGGATEALYLGDPISGGATDANPASFNIIDGFDLTGGSAARGLHVQSSGYNVFANGRVYQNDGQGAYINGNNLRPANFNIIQNNIIYNTPDQAVFIGYMTSSADHNHAHFNHILDNELYQSGFGSLAKFDNAVKVASKNERTVIEGNNIRDITLQSVDNGAVMVGSRTHHTMVYGNLIRNINRQNTGTHAYVMAADSIDSLLVFNNVLKRESPLSNQVYGFRLNGTLHDGSRVIFNSMNNIPRGFYLEDYGTSVDVTIQNNIVNTGTPYFQSAGTGGRFTVGYNGFPSIPAFPYGGATGDVIGDPQYVSPGTESANGLMLSETSPCLGAGITDGDISLDYLGFVRNPTPTIGAFEEALILVTWTGNQNDDWDDYRNWDFEVVPTSFLNASVPATPDDPVIYRGNAACKSLDVGAGAVLTIQQPFQLEVGNP